MLVGGNGAGKSTFYELFLKCLGLPFVNADNLAKIAYPEDPEGRSRDAAKLAEGMRKNLLLSGQSFCFETVYSHPSKIDFAAEAKALGYYVVLVMIHLSDTSLNQARVAERVSEGGHSVPAEKIVTRVPRMLAHVRMSIPLCDLVRAYDNSSQDDPYQRVFTIEHGITTKHLNPLPGWAERLLLVAE
ncbi:MAG: zeta toxin family protein [Candidatus Thiodiazotropha sp. (ex Epidulcina cf. delphinae)]|nr:zeta toxin family protein [Candidatus Thiodiazotropha sp. (ex Epidulcina cf. delphinae)]